MLRRALMRSAASVSPTAATGESGNVEILSGVSVEQFFEERLAALVRLLAIMTLPVPCASLWRCRRRGCAGIPFDNLVELAAIQPYAATLRAVIDLDNLPLAHHQRNCTDGARHTSAGVGHIHISNVHDSIRHHQSDQHRAKLDAVRHRDRLIDRQRGPARKINDRIGLHQFQCWDERADERAASQSWNETPSA